MSDAVKVTNTDGVLVLTLSRAEKKNALTEAMYGKLADAMEAAEQDPQARVILLQAEGELFTAGNDLGEFAAFAASGAQGPRNVHRFLHALASASRPIVAAVQGKAVGIGVTLLLHCDYVLLSKDAQLTTPFVGLALVPEAASSLLLTARIGHARAFAMFALGEALRAPEALACGIANQVVAGPDLAAAAAQVAQRLAAQPLGALAATKRLMRDAEAIMTQMEAESTEFVARLKSPEAREAFTAFMEKRKPDFSKFS